MKKIILYGKVLALSFFLFNPGLSAQVLSLGNYIKNKDFTKIAPELIWLNEMFMINGQSTSFRSQYSYSQLNKNEILLELLAAGNPINLLEELQSMNIPTNEAQYFGRKLCLNIPIEKIKSLQSLSQLKFASLPSPRITNTGLVTSQADIALRAIEARQVHNVDGSGITIGVLSDSFDALSGYAGDVTNGELPLGINVLDDINSGSDEGRAMLQLIHDLAPGANLAFHTAFQGEVDFANGILELQNDGNCQVIVDDVIYFSEPFFQDGIIAQAADQIVENGGIYFSSAGNSGKDAYEGTNGYSTAIYQVNFFGTPINYQLYDFDPSQGADYFQAISVPGNATIQLSLQWEEPFFSISGPPGAQTDLDIFIFGSDAVTNNQNSITVNSTPLAFSVANNIVSGEPIEIISTNIGPNPTTLYLAIGLYAGPPPQRVKYVSFGGINSIDEFDTESATCVGHANAKNAIAVGASFYGYTPAFGSNPTFPRLEDFSSRGGTPILFNLNGTPMNRIRNKPEITAADGTNTSFFGSDIGFDSDNFPNFFGTSAAAPHAAAIAALMLEKQPGATKPLILAALQNTSIDVQYRTNGEFTGVGFDFDSGYGLIQADAAITELNSLLNNTVSLSAKVFLQGPYNVNEMAVSLNTLNLIPKYSPYEDLPGFSDPNNALQFCTTDRVLDLTGSNAIVDWVFLELREENDVTQVVASRSALLQADGDIVDVDGSSPVVFYGVSAGNYYIAVKHRNHLGIRTNQTEFFGN